MAGTVWRADWDEEEFGTHADGLQAIEEWDWTTPTSWDLIEGASTTNEPSNLNDTEQDLSRQKDVSKQKDAGNTVPLDIKPTA